MKTPADTERSIPLAFDPAVVDEVAALLNEKRVELAALSARCVRHAAIRADIAALERVLRMIEP